MFFFFLFSLKFGNILNQILWKQFVYAKCKVKIILQWHDLMVVPNHLRHSPSLEGKKLITPLISSLTFKLIFYYKYMQAYVLLIIDYCQHITSLDDLGFFIRRLNKLVDEWIKVAKLLMKSTNKRRNMYRNHNCNI